MKKMLTLLAAVGLAFGAFASGELVATGAGMTTITVGKVGGGVISNADVRIDRNACVPWKIEVLEATKAGEPTTTTETIYTNYVCSITTTNTVVRPNYVDGKVQGVTNIVTVSTVTNNFPKMPSAPWVEVSKSGYEKTITVPQSAVAGGTVKLSCTEGYDWGALTLTEGKTSNTNVLDMSKVGFVGTLKLTATEAERVKVKITYLKLK